MCEGSTTDEGENILALLETELGALLKDETVSKERIRGYADAIDRVHAARGGQAPWHYLKTVSTEQIEEHRKRAKEFHTYRDR